MAYNFVTEEFIKNQMIKHKRSVFYICDSQDQTLALNEDESLTPEAAFTLLQNYLQDISGAFVFIRLHAASPKRGQGAKTGGYMPPVFRYRLNLQENNGIAAPQAPQAGNMNLQIMQSFYTQIGELQKQLLTNQFDSKLKALEDQINNKSGRGKDDLINLVLDKGMEKYYAREKMVKAAETLSGKAAPIADKADKKKADSEGAKMMEAMRKLSTVDNDLLQNLEMIADLAVKNPTGYNSFISTLKDLK